MFARREKTPDPNERTHLRHPRMCCFRTMRCRRSGGWNPIFALHLRTSNESPTDAKRTRVPGCSAYASARRLVHNSNGRRVIFHPEQASRFIRVVWVLYVQLFCIGTLPRHVVILKTRLHELQRGRTDQGSAQLTTLLY